EVEVVLEDLEVVEPPRRRGGPPGRQALGQGRGGRQWAGAGRVELGRPRGVAGLGCPPRRGLGGHGRRRPGSLPSRPRRCPGGGRAGSPRRGDAEDMAAELAPGLLTRLRLVPLEAVGAAGALEGEDHARTPKPSVAGRRARGRRFGPGSRGDGDTLEPEASVLHADAGCFKHALWSRARRQRPPFFGSAGFSSVGEAGGSGAFSKVMMCCQGRNSWESLKVKPWGSISF